MSPAEPLLILTDDDLLAEHWQALGRSPVRARRVGDLDTWRSAGHRLVLVDLDPRRADAPLWQHAAWQRNAAGLAILAASAQPNDDVKGLSYLGWFQALALADLGQGEAALRKARATLADDAVLRSDAEHWEIGRRQYALIRRFIEQYLPYLRHHGIVGQIAQLLQPSRR